MFCTAQFWWADQLSNWRWITRAPAALAISTVRSVLNESNTTTSSLHVSDARHDGRLISSLYVRISTEIMRGALRSHASKRLVPLLPHRLLHVQVDHELVHHDEPAVRQPRPAVEEAEPQDVHVDESQDRPERHEERELLQRLAPPHGIADGKQSLEVRATARLLEEFAGFEPSVLNVLVDPRANALAEAVVDDVAVERSDRSVDDGNGIHEPF